MPRGFQKGHQTWSKGKSLGHKFLLEHRDFRQKACLIWPYSRDTNGRGQFGYLGVMHRAHRFMCELVHGPCPPGKECAHSCGKGHLGCVNPSHLSWQTRSENHLDRRRHGTHKTSPYGRTGRLTAKDRAEIVADPTPGIRLASKYGVHAETINRVRREGKSHNAV